MDAAVSKDLSATILIVDDDPDICEALCDMLEHEGYRVHAVGTGVEAIQQASHIHYDAVLLDIELPDLNGHTVLRVLTEADPSLPVVILTGYPTEQNTVRSLSKGAIAYTAKPYNPAEIKAILRRAVAVKALSVKAETATHALSESEERFRSVVQSTSDAIILADGNGRIVFWNKGAQRMFSYTEDEVMGKPLTMIMPSRYREAHHQGLEQIKTSGEGCVTGRTLELHGLRKDGSEFPLELSLATWRTPEGLFFGGIIRDITERKRIEAVLEQLRRQHELLLNSAGEGIYGLDRRGNTTFVNPAAARMLGWVAEDLIGRCMHLVLHHTRVDGSPYPSDSCPIYATLKDGSVRSVEDEVFWRKDGTSFPVEYVSTPIREDGEITGAVVVFKDITERKRVEEALASSEERFRQLAENIQEVFWMSDPSKNVMVYVSPAYEEIWGRTCASLYASPRSWLEAIHPEDRGRVLHAALTKQVTGEYHEDYRIIRADGSVRWIRDRAFPVRGALGVIDRIAGLAEDITDQKSSERRRAAQYAVTRVLAEANTLSEATPKILQAICEGLEWDVGAIWRIDEHARVLRCLDLWQAPGIQARPFEEFSRQTAFAYGVGLPGRVWASGKPTWIADVTQDANFPRGPVAAVVGLHGALAFPIKLNDQVLGVFEFFSRDICRPDDDLLEMLGSIGSQIGQFTERKQAQEALRLAYDKIDAILVSLPCAILIIDREQRIVYANPLTSRHFWPEHSTLAGSALQEVLPLSPSQWKHLVNDLEAAAADGGPVREREFRARARVYRYRPFPVTLRGDHRHQVGLVIWDVTEQKLLQEQLIQAEKLASLGTLVSGMAHEVNNPVQGIMGMAEIILQEPDLNKMREYARDIVAYSEHIGAVVRGFAMYARPSSRDGEVEVDLGERLCEAVKLIQRCPQFGHVEVLMEFEPLPKMRARRSEIDQVFVNLISNAVDAMKGTGRLTLATQWTDQMACIRIADTGCGIPQTMIGKIFDPFVTTKDPGKGTGLGLSIAHTIVSKYDGRISVESEEGKGTTFTIRFPIERP